MFGYCNFFKIVIIINQLLNIVIANSATFIRFFVVFESNFKSLLKVQNRNSDHLSDRPNETFGPS